MPVPYRTLVPTSVIRQMAVALVDHFERQTHSTEAARYMAAENIHTSYDWLRKFEKGHSNSLSYITGANIYAAYVRLCVRIEEKTEQLKEGPRDEAIESTVRPGVCVPSPSPPRPRNAPRLPGPGDD